MRACARRPWESVLFPLCATFCTRGLAVSDFDVIELNEAFASQAFAVARELGFSRKVNPNEGAIALGHPVGATGAMVSIEALDELERISGNRALISMCIGGGQGIAIAIERTQPVQAFPNLSP